MAEYVKGTIHGKAKSEYTIHTAPKREEDEPASPFPIPL